VRSLTVGYPWPSLILCTRVPIRHYFSATIGPGHGTLGKHATFVGKRVEARYRAENLSHHVKGRLALDTGTSIFIEDRFSEDGREKTMRIEIPCEFILRVVEVAPDEHPSRSA
jgi:hypothetical protein